MPIYEFKCEDCGKGFEELVLGSNPGIKCPHCQGERVKRLLSTFGLSTSKGFSSSAGPSCGPCTPNPSKCSVCR
ncbi:MAG: zinc ribbon domain-containing protein [Deltaproteobacteria bacterium]|nr:zinc ribbon domain-containing protein [Deltaproteobacteria bacterium]